LKQRLKHFTKDQLLTAWKTISKDKFLRGQNQHKKDYATFEYCVRNDEIIERNLYNVDTCKILKQEILDNHDISPEKINEYVVNGKFKGEIKDDLLRGLKNLRNTWNKINEH